MRTWGAAAGVLVASGLAISCGSASDAPDAEGPECEVATDCPSGICTQNVCIDTKDVLCADAAPANATSTPATVTVTYTDGSGWSDPAACAWSCDTGYCMDGDACSTVPPDVFYDPGPGGRWFGGDDRVPEGPRSLGDGESFRLAQLTTVKGLSLYFDASFGSATTMVPAVTTVHFDLRDATGVILQAGDVIVPTTYTGGWLTWDVVAELDANTTYILDAYVPGVFATNTTNNNKSTIRTVFDDLYPDGTSWQAIAYDDTVDLSDWNNWQENAATDSAWGVVLDDVCP